MTETIESPSRRGSTPRTPSAPRGRAAQQLLVGGVPRVDLLPAEVHIDRRQRAVGRRAWVGVVVVAVVVGIGTGAATMSRISAEDDLTAAQAETTTLLQQQLQYRDVRTTESATTLLEAAQQVGGSTEVDWQKTLRSVQDRLPQGVSITGVSVDSATATDAFAQSDDPLQGQRIATLTFDARSATLPSIPDWLTAVHDVTGFVDANANSVTRDDESGQYTVNMTIHLDEKAFDGKYAASSGKG